MNANIDFDEDGLAKMLKALANKKRLKIMGWILDPVVHFPPQVEGDLVEDGVCVCFITNKIGLTQPTVTSHMNVLAAAGLVSQKKIKNWVFYKPDRDVLRQIVQSMGTQLGVN